MTETRHCEECGVELVQKHQLLVWYVTREIGEPQNVGVIKVLKKSSQQATGVVAVF